MSLPPNELPPCRSNPAQPDRCICLRDKECPCGPNAECESQPKPSPPRGVTINDKVSKDHSEVATPNVPPVTNEIFESSPPKSIVPSPKTVEDLIKKKLLTPCRTCAIESYKEGLKTNGLDLGTFQTTLCETCSRPQTESCSAQQTDSISSQQTLSKDQCPPNISASTSCANWKTYVSDLVKENIQSLINENLRCLSNCTGKPLPNKPREIEKPVPDKSEEVNKSQPDKSNEVDKSLPDKSKEDDKTNPHTTNKES